MSSVSLPASPLYDSQVGPVVAVRRKLELAPPLSALEILSAALEREDRALTEEPGPPAAAPGKRSGFDAGASPAEGFEASAAASGGRSTFAPGMAIVRAYRQRRAGLEETMLALYHGNLSMFRAEETAHLLWGGEINSAAISSCTQEVMPRLEAWLRQPITRRYDFVFLDKLVIRQRVREATHETALHYAVGIDARGGRDVLGVEGGDAADDGVWSGFLRDLRQRGLKQVRLFIGGMDETLVRAVAGEFPAVRLQVCVAQLEHEVLARVPGSELHLAIQACAVLHPRPDADISGEKVRQMLECLDRNEMAEASNLLVRMLPLAFSYRPFPRHHWRQISTIDGIRRAVKPLRERIRHIGPVDETRALVGLAAAHLRHVSRTVWGRRPYLRAK